MLRTPTHDDRERSVRLVRWMPGGPRLAVRSPLVASLALLGVLGAIVAAVVVLVGPDAVGLVIFSVVIAPTMAVVLTALAAARTAWRDRPHALRRSMALRRLCASCAYDLSANEPEPDGCTVCPECSAAWRFADDNDPPTVVVVAQEK